MDIAPLTLARNQGIPVISEIELAYEFIDAPLPYRVLLGEDHMSLANATAFLMRLEGLEVWIAATGREALALADTVRPDIVLCDLRLPDMSGLDVARELRVRPGAKDALVAIHTAMSEGSPETYRQHRDEFVNLYLPKPLTVEKVGVLISELLALRHSVSRAAARRRRH
jgi:CheY-like chemotaxis protein